MDVKAFLPCFCSQLHLSLGSGGNEAASGLVGSVGAGHPGGVRNCLVPGTGRDASINPACASPLAHAERDAFDTLFDHAPDKLSVVKKVSSGPGCLPPSPGFSLHTRSVPGRRWEHV